MHYNASNQHHSHSLSSIPLNSSPHYNINMNGHLHHVGGNHLNTGMISFRQSYNQNPYQSVGNISQYNQQYPINHQYNSLSHHNLMQQNTNIGIPQNFTLQNSSTPQYQNSNFTPINQRMSHPNHDLNPYGQQLGGYHNQGYESHSGQANLGQAKNQ